MSKLNTWRRSAVLDLIQAALELPELIRKAYVTALQKELALAQWQANELQGNVKDADKEGVTWKEHWVSRDDVERKYDECEILRLRLSDLALQPYLAFCDL